MIALFRWLPPALASAALAAGPPIEPWQVRAELQIIQLEEAHALPLIAQFTDEPQRAAPELQRLLADGTATLTAHLIGCTSNNLQCETSQFEEMRYSTDFYPFIPEIHPLRKKGPALEPIPFPALAFSYRQIGPSFSIVAYVHPSGRIVRIVPNILQRDFGGMERFESGIQHDGTKLCFDLPISSVRENSTELLVLSGAPTLIGCCRLAGKKHRYELHVITTRVRLPDGSLPDAAQKNAPPNPDGSEPPIPALPTGQTRIELHRFVLPETDALGLRAALLDSAKIESAFSTLLAKVKTGSCELTGILSIPLHDKARAVFGNNREQMYPTEFDFGGHMGGPTTPIPLQPIWDNPPNAFETRQVGERFEAEVSFNSSNVELLFISQVTAQHGFNRWATGGNERTQSVSTYSYQPDFTNGASRATISLADRQRTLLRFQKLPAPDGRVEITLIRAITEHFTPDTKP